MKIKNEQFFMIIKKFLQIYLAKNRCYSKNTIKSYTDSLNLYFVYLEKEEGIPLNKVDWDCFHYENVNNFLTWLDESRKCSRATQLQRLTAIRTFIRYAGILDVTTVSSQAEIDKIKIRKPEQKLIPYLSKKQLTVFLSQPDISKRNGLRDMVFLIMMYDTAARCQEMLDIKIGDLVLDCPSPYVYLTGKGNKTRTVPLMDKTVLHIRNYLNKFHPLDIRCSKDYLFFTVSHGEHHRMSEDNVAAFVKKYGEQAKKVCSDIPERVHPHMLRHTRAMHLYQDGIPLTLLSEILGHSQIETTKIYAYADTTMKREAIQKVTRNNSQNISEAIWANDTEMIQKLVGLK